MLICAVCCLWLFACMSLRTSSVYSADSGPAWLGNHWPLARMGAGCRGAGSAAFFREDERACAAYFKEVGSFQLLGREEEIECLARIQAGDSQALERLIKANQGFVIALARKYRDKGCLTFLDLIAEGNLGLLEAARDWDQSRAAGARFITYAKWKVRQSIERAIDNNLGTVRIPVHRTAEIKQIRFAEDQLVQELGRRPLIEELQERLTRHGLERLRRRSLLKLGRDPSPQEEKERLMEMRVKWTAEYVAETFELMERREYPVAENNLKSRHRREAGHCLLYGTLRSDRQAERSSLRDLLRAALRRLTPAQREVFEACYLSGSFSAATRLEDLSEKLGVTQQAVSDRHTGGLKRLRSHIAPLIRAALREEWKSM